MKNKIYVPTYESYVGLDNKLIKNINDISSELSINIDTNKIMDTNIKTDIFYVYIEDEIISIITNNTAKSLIDKNMIGLNLPIDIIKEFYDINDKPTTVNNKTFYQILECKIVNSTINIYVNDKARDINYRAIIKGFDFRDHIRKDLIKPTKIKVGKLFRNLLNNTGQQVSDELITKLTELFDYQKFNGEYLEFKYLKGHHVFDGYDSSKVVSTSSLGSSCMMDIETINDESVPFTDLLALYDTRTNLIVARAYIWKISEHSPLKSKYEYFVDRVYMSSDHIRRFFEDYVKSKNYLYRTAGVEKYDIVDLNTKDKINKKDLIVDGVIEVSFDKFDMLYLDTFIYANLKENLLSITPNELCRLVTKNDPDQDYYGLNVLLDYNVKNFYSEYNIDGINTIYELDDDRFITVFEKSELVDELTDKIDNSTYNDLEYMPTITKVTSNSYNPDYCQIYYYGEKISHSNIDDIEEYYDTLINKINDKSSYDNLLEELDLYKDSKNFFENFYNMYHKIKNDLNFEIEKEMIDFNYIYKNLSGNVTWYPIYQKDF